MSRSASSGISQRIHWSRPDLRFRGKIIRSIFDQARSTADIAYDLDATLGYVRGQLIRLHHLGLVEPIAIREEEGGGLPRPIGYYQDLVWNLTRHAREHRHQHANCWACTVREMLLASAEVVYE